MLWRYEPPLALPPHPLTPPPPPPPFTSTPPPASRSRSLMKTLPPFKALGIFSWLVVYHHVCDSLKLEEIHSWLCHWRLN